MVDFVTTKFNFEKWPFELNPFERRSPLCTGIVSVPLPDFYSNSLQVYMNYEDYEEGSSTAFDVD